MTDSSTSSSTAAGGAGGKNNVVVKVGMVGDATVGKTTLMVKYVENKFDEEYIMTLGVNFMEKTIILRNTEITFSVWDLGGQREFLSMLPLVCNDAIATLFMFDLSRKSTLNSVREWYATLPKLSLHDQNVFAARLFNLNKESQPLRTDFFFYHNTNNDDECMWIYFIYAQVQASPRTEPHGPCFFGWHKIR